MKTITMDFKEYEEELNQNRLRGQDSGIRFIFRVQNLIKNGKNNEAVVQVIDFYDGCSQRELEKVLNDLGILQFAKELWAK